MPAMTRPDQCGAELPDYFGTRVCRLLPDHGGDWHDDGARQWSTRDGSIRPVDETITKDEDAR
jgi:hypothetical protein